MFTTTERSKGRILDFDIENRPLSYWWGDVTTAEITAIAWQFYDEDIQSPHVAYLLAPPNHETSAVQMLTRFRQVYDRADMVTGHFIRKHDLPIINSAMIEYGLPTLGAKMTSDTKLDFIKHGSFSASQLALSKVLDVKAPKPRMTTNRWRDANRLTDEGIAATVERVTGDVRQHMEMRAALLKAGLLGPPRLWTPKP